MTQAPDPLDEYDEDTALDRMLTAILREPDDDETLLIAIDCGIMPPMDYSRLEINPDDTERMFRLIYRGPDDAAPEPEDAITKLRL